MKKESICLLGLFAFAVVLFSCKTNIEPHVHTFSNQWSSNETDHWHEATCEHTSEVSDKANHSWDYEDYQFDSESGKDIRKCTVCLKIDRKSHEHNSATTWIKTATTHKETYACCGAVKTEETAHTWNHSDYQYDSDTEKEIRTCTVCLYEDEKNHEHSSATTWTKTATTHKETYVCCGVIKTEETAHLWDPEDYQYESESGKEKRNCTVCLYVDEKDHVHTENSGTLTTPVTLTSDGEKTYECTVCHTEVRKETIKKPSFNQSPVDVTTGDPATTDSTNVYFGVFPKTVKSDDVTVDEKISVVMGANTYYRGDDDNWYAKVTENASKSDYKYTDGTTVKQSSTKSTRYFKVEPIKWKVLNKNYNGKSLLVATEILTGNVPYYVNTAERTISDKTIYANNYKYSTVRAYLNGKYEADDTQSKTEYENKGFLQTAFTASAQGKIAETTVDNSKETTGYDDDTYSSNYWCGNTEDKIFLLSGSEVKGISGGNCIRVTTDYAKANFAFQSASSGNGGYWWLRSPYKDNSIGVRFVDNGGTITRESDVNYTQSGIVPALSISFKKINDL